MRALSAGTILKVWEEGAQERPAEWALTLLGHALPQRARESLAALPVGRRDALLLAVRARIFGDALPGYAECPACGEPFEFALSTAELLDGAPGAEGAPAPATLEMEGVMLRLRLPDGGDLAQLAAADVGDATRWLLGRCVERAERGGEALDPTALPARVVAGIEAWMAAEDPLASLALALRCAACGEAWRAAFDVASYLRVEIAARARRLVGEVHALAQAYGWREADILKMSAARRQAYLQLVGAS